MLGSETFRDSKKRGPAPNGQIIHVKNQYLFVICMLRMKEWQQIAETVNREMTVEISLAEGLDLFGEMKDATFYVTSPSLYACNTHINNVYWVAKSGVLFDCVVVSYLTNG
jgi:hypothetical protein